jgi:hypothetical protein
MSKLTFGIEMEMFIKNTIIIQKIIREEMTFNECYTFQELVSLIITETTYLKNEFIKYKSPFTRSIDNEDFKINELQSEDYYLIMLIITYIICKNKKLSFTLFHYVTRCNGDIIYFKDYKQQLNWYYDIDRSVNSYFNVKTYRTIYDKFPKILLPKDLIMHTEFVSGIYDNPEEVKYGVSTLISSLTDLKLIPLHSEHTSNHIHFSIKKENSDDLGIKDPYLIFCITYIFYVLQNFIYLICLPERRISEYCAPLEIKKSHWSKNFDEFTLDEFFDVLVTMELPIGDEKCYLDHVEIDRLKCLLLEANNVMLPSKELLKRIKNLEAKIKKLTTLPKETTNKPFKDLKFEHQLIVIMHFYHAYSGCKMDDDLKKYIISVKYIDELERYKILNLKKLSERQSCTLELRVKHGSNDSTEISNFCILIEKIVNVSEQMVANKHISLLTSLANILNVDEKELLAFKSIKPKDLSANYESQKYLLKNILNGLFKDKEIVYNNVNIRYWLKQLKRINDSNNPLNSSNSRKKTL